MTDSRYGYSWDDPTNNEAFGFMGEASSSRPNITLYLNGVRLDAILASEPKPDKPLSPETLALLEEADYWARKREERKTRFYDE